MRAALAPAGRGQPLWEDLDVSSPRLSASGAAVVIPALNEQARIASTVRAAAEIEAIDLVVVVDDGSTDETSDHAMAAGGHVVRHATNQGKAAAMERGAAVVAELESAAQVEPRPLLFLDGDLESTASAAAVLLPPVLSGDADMTVATLPPQSVPGGGHGFVVRLARDGIEEATGWLAEQPLSGQRAMSRAAFDAALPLATGFGVEVGLSIDLLRKGFRVLEVPADFHHRVTGSDWRAKRHRARQYWAVWRALRARGVGPTLPIPR